MVNAGLFEKIIKFCTGLIDEKLKTELRTTIPGYVVAFDPATQLAIAQVGVQRLNIDGTTYNPPPIIRCPVKIYGAAGGALEVKIEQGDECLIHFSMRCIDGWRTQGGIAPLVKVERFRETDAFIEMGVRSQQNVLTEYTNDGIKLRSKDNSVYVWLKDSGEIEAKNESGFFKLLSIGNVDANGATIDTDGNVITADDANVNDMRDKLNELIARFNSHAHTGNSGSPTPLIGAPVAEL